MFNKPHSEETKRKISKALKGKYIGKKNPHWKDGIQKRKDGRILIHLHKHPFASKSRKVVYLHRLIMEKKIGRYLKPEEVVHHINHDEKDNSPENLYLFPSQSAHKSYEDNVMKTYLKWIRAEKLNRD